MKNICKLKLMYKDKVIFIKNKDYFITTNCDAFMVSDITGFIISKDLLLRIPINKINKCTKLLKKYKIDFILYNHKNDYIVYSNKDNKYYDILALYKFIYKQFMVVYSFMKNDEDKIYNFFERSYHEEFLRY